MENPEKRIDQIIEKDGRYKEEAYLFVRDAFVYAIQKAGDGVDLGGRELLRAIKELGLERYGPTARIVFEHWGVKTTQDFGRVIFNMVEVGLMSKSEDDTIEEFEDVFDFREEFERKYRFRIDVDAL